MLTRDGHRRVFLADSADIDCFFPHQYLIALRLGRSPQSPETKCWAKTVDLKQNILLESASQGGWHHPGRQITATAHVQVPTPTPAHAPLPWRWSGRLAFGAPCLSYPADCLISLTDEAKKAKKTPRDVILLRSPNFRIIFGAISPFTPYLEESPKFGARSHYWCKLPTTLDSYSK